MHSLVIDGTPNSSAPVQAERLEATCALGKIVWHQYLKISKFANVIYLDEGNGEITMK